MEPLADEGKALLLPSKQEGGSGGGKTVAGSGVAAMLSAVGIAVPEDVALLAPAVAAAGATSDRVRNPKREKCVGEGGGGSILF